MLNKPLLAILCLCLPTLSYAKMYKCTVDGKTTYSQTECTGNVAVFKSFDSDKFHQDTIQQYNLNELQSIENASRDELDSKYEKERKNIESQIQGINLDLDQPIRQLLANKKLKQQLEKELKNLNLDYQKMVDPGKSNPREIMNELMELRAEINKMKGK